MTREDAKVFMRKEWRECMKGSFAESAFEIAIEALEQPERKKGKWIIKDNPGTGWYRITCSECGEDVTSTAPCIGFYPNAKVMWNYCPDCGARMEGEGC